MPVLFVLFLLVPLAELYVIVVVAHSLGLGNTLGVLVLVSLVGAAIVKRQGTGALARIREALARHELPSAHIADGGLILLAGALLLVPGFITDALGLLLLLPPVRAAACRVVLVWFGASPRRVRIKSTGPVIDTDTTTTGPSTPRGELGNG